MKYFKLFLLLFLTNAARGTEFQKIGTAGFVFLELPVSARFVGLGETGISLPDARADGLFFNPALIALNTERLGLTMSYADWYVETTHQAFGVTYHNPLFGTIGVSVVSFDFGEVEKTINPTAAQTGSYIQLGTYTAGAYAVGVSYARSLTDKFSFGFSLKYARETIDAYSADNVIADLGFLYLTGFHSLRIGAALQNFGLEAKYAAEKFKMPQQLRLGISAEVLGQLSAPNHLTAILEASHPNDADERIQLGLEGVLSRWLVLRGGYKFGHDEENWTLGSGLIFPFKGKRVNFDCAYFEHKRLDSTLRYTLAMEF
jgi:hypothetical protein